MADWRESRDLICPSTRGLLDSDDQLKSDLVVGVVGAATLLLVLPVEWLPAIAVVAFPVMPNIMFLSG